MKSLNQIQKSHAKKMNNRGVLGMETARDVIIFLLVLSVTAIAVFLALVSLQDSGIFKAGSQAKNQTDNVINNVTSGTVDFFKNIPTVMTILGAVVIILAVVLILVAVGRFTTGAGGVGGL